MDHDKLIFATPILSQGFKFTELVTINKVDWMFLQNSQEKNKINQGLY